jgi:hypothetical protein
VRAVVEKSLNLDLICLALDEESKFDHPKGKYGDTQFELDLADSHAQYLPLLAVLTKSAYHAELVSIQLHLTDENLPHFSPASFKI